MTASARTRPGIRPDADGDYLLPLLGLTLTDEQRAAVTAPLAPQLVVAGAGSGKTAVMAARVVHAVAWHQLAPSAVLGLTFTNKAAAELAARVRRALRELAIDGDPAGSADDLPTVATYHSYAARLFGEHALRIGREPAAGLLTEAGRWQLAARVVRTARGPFPDLKWTAPTVIRYLLDLDAELAEHGCPVDELRAYDRGLLDHLAAAGPSAPDSRPTRAVLDTTAALRAREHLLDLVVDYRRRKVALDLVDFGDQVALAGEIAGRSAEVGAGERARFGLVLLDEYQDTGVAQRRLLVDLFGGGHPVTAVGDPCQSIYGWRGASVGNLLRFHQHFGAPAGSRAQFLTTNFRSGGRVLAVANTVSRELREPRPGGRRPRFEVPQLRAAPDCEDVGTIRCALLPTVQDEASWLADQVAATVGAGVSAGAVAVLCRRRADFAVLHAALVERGLPVEVVGLGGLLETPEVADVVATLEVLADPTANAAAIRLLTGARWALGLRDLGALGRRAKDLAGSAARAPVDAEADPSGELALAQATTGVDPCDVVSLLEVVESPGSAEDYSTEGWDRLRRFAAELSALRRVLQQPVVEAVHEVISGIGLDVEIVAGPAPMAAARSANLAALVDHAAHFVAATGESDVRAFLGWLCAAREAEDGLDVGAISRADTVKLLTVHKAKGLEWDVVAVAGLCDEIFPSAKGRPAWPTSARTLPFALRGDRDDLPPDPEWTPQGMDALRVAFREEAAEEERRLGYVALTRARRVLITSGHRWAATGRQTAYAPSPYLLELRDVLAATGGAPDVWVDDPGPANPLLGAVVDVPWPAPVDEVGRARRREAAALVEAVLAGADVTAGATLAPADRIRVAGWAEEAALIGDEAAAGRAAARAVVLPRTLTASQVVRLREAPDELARSLARPLPRQPSAAASRGTRFHAWVEQRWSVRPLFDDIPGAADPPPPDDVELAALRRAFEQSAYADRRPCAVEAPFQLVLASHVIRGRIDAVYPGAGGSSYEVIDYKTGARPDPRSAALQLAVYRCAWADLAGVPDDSVRAGFLYVQTGDVVWPDLPGRVALARWLDGADETETGAIGSRP